MSFFNQIKVTTPQALQAMIANINHSVKLQHIFYFNDWSSGYCRYQSQTLA
jgi:hypothetical protein